MESPNVTSASATVGAVLSGATTNISAVLYSMAENFSIYKMRDDKFTLMRHSGSDGLIGMLESETLIGLLYQAERERVYGVLDLKDEEAHLLFGQAFLRSHREFVTWQLLTHQA